jgi:energy-coupling factor transport system ATP-binding protein
VLLLGASGAGKSTLLAGLAGLLDPGEQGDGGAGDEEGALLLDGVPARRARHQAVADGQARTGLLLQDPVAQTVLSRCGDDVAFGLENHAVPPALIGPRVEAALRGVAFPYAAAHPTSALSGGERQRLALAGVLALRPGLLLLDEPSAMLDDDGARVLREHVAAVLAATGATCVLVEHRLEGWLDLVDRVVVLAPPPAPSPAASDADSAGPTRSAAAPAVVADGPPARVFAEHGEDLAARGVWVPGAQQWAVDRATRTVSLPGAGDELLVARDLAVTHPARRRAGLPPVLEAVDLEILAGTATCLTGPNGAGKSTLALTLAGLAAPAAGTVTATAALRGDLRAAAPHRWRPRDLVQRIGTVFQEPEHQFVASTVADELAVGPRAAGVRGEELEARVADLLDRLRLTHLARANPYTLSGGEQRRLSVAGVLAARPRVLVLDEPTFGQDARTWAELVALLRELLADGTAVVAATHDPALVEALDARVHPVARRSAPVGAQ